MHVRRLDTGSTNITNIIVFMHESFEIGSKVQLLGINISTVIYDMHLSDTVIDIFIVIPIRFYLISALFLVILNQDLCLHIV